MCHVSCHVSASLSMRRDGFFETERCNVPSQHFHLSSNLGAAAAAFAPMSALAATSGVVSRAAMVPETDTVMVPERDSL